MNFLRDMFSWPTGEVWGNIIADLLWLIPAYLWGRFHFKKLHLHHKKAEQ